MQSSAVLLAVAGGGFAQLSVTCDITEERAVDVAVTAALKDTRLALRGPASTLA